MTGSGLAALLDVLIGRLDAEAASAGQRRFSQALLPPAPVASLDDAERAMDRLLPAEVRDLYLWHDGSASQLFPSCAFHTLAQALAGRDDILPFPVPPVAHAVSDPGPGDLLPIFSTDGADYCVELSVPGATALTTAPIYYVDLAAESSVQMARSLRAFLQHVTVRLDDPGLEITPFGLIWIESDWLVFPSTQMEPWS